MIDLPLIFDGHNDTLSALYRAPLEQPRSFFERGEQGHLDLPRALEGRFGGGFFAVYAPADPSVPALDGPELTVTDDGYEVRLPPPLEQRYALGVAMAVTASLFRLERESAGRLQVVRTAEELAGCLRQGILAAVLHFEGAEAIDTDLAALEVLYQAGLRSLGPVWSRPNAFGSGVPFRYPHSPDLGNGLTKAGRALVRACNQLGIMIDLSHLNERGFWDVAALSTAPLVATHSNAHAITPSTRNLTDRQLDAIRDSDGMVGLSFTVSDLRPDGHDDADTPLAIMIQHIDYLVQRLGINRVGFGSDFDGTTVPRAIGDVTGLPLLLTALFEHGYDEPALRKLAHENWLRVLGATWHEPI